MNLPTILANVFFPQALGVYCDGRTVYVARVAGTPRAGHAMQQIRVPVEASGESHAVHEALRLIGPRAAGLPVAFGVPAERCYFTTRPITVAADASPAVLLRESLRAGSANLDRLLADTVRSRPDKRDVVSIAACDRQWLDTQCQPLVSSTSRLVAAEPAVCALMRLAEREDRKSRKFDLVVRVFLSDGEALAVLARQSQPILWRTTPLARGDEAATILALVRSLLTVAKPCGVERSPDAVVICGRPDLQRLVDIAWICENLKLPFRWQERPSLSGDDIAHGLAVRALQEHDDGFDLAHAQRQPPALGRMFPWRDAVACVVAVLAMAGLLGQREQQLGSAAASARRAADQLVAADVSASELENRKRDLEARVAAVKKFVGSRACGARSFGRCATVCRTTSI